MDNAFFTHFSKADKISSYKVAKTEYFATLGEGVHITGKRPMGIGNLEMAMLWLCVPHLPYSGSFKEHGNSRNHDSVRKMLTK